ncbi:MAG: DUF192 domain-containing protein [Actinomycetota bacterium]|nr:DUF192 domain-containing protein [Actinomycetota bacterium]
MSKKEKIFEKSSCVDDVKVSIRDALLVENISNGEIIARKTRIATKTKERMRGLIGRESLAGGEAMLFPGCSQIHTFFMRFPIDVIFVGKDGLILKSYRELAPWRVTTISTQSAFALEMPPGTLQSSRTNEGDSIRLRTGGNAQGFR